MLRSVTLTPISGWGLRAKLSRRCPPPALQSKGPPLSHSSSALGTWEVTANTDHSCKEPLQCYRGKGSPCALPISLQSDCTQARARGAAEERGLHRMQEGYLRSSAALSWCPGGAGEEGGETHAVTSEHVWTR